MTSPKAHLKMSNNRAVKITASWLALAASIGTAKAVEWAGFVGVDLRFYTETAAFPEQNTSFAQPSVLLQPEFRHEWTDGANRFTAIPFARYDSLDTNRSHWDVREFNWLHKSDNWTLQTGVGKVFWGVTESRHLVDIINQTDFVENINSEEKLGQPMVNLNVPTDYGNINLMYLPYFRERTFPAANGRVRFVYPVDADNQDMNGISHWHPDWAARWSHTFGGWDVGVAHFSGVGREPRLVPRFGNGLNAAPTALVPTYDLINQTSLDVQGVMDNWLIKLEAITRTGQGERFAALVTGFEYTFYSIQESEADLGVLMEYQYDGRDKFAPPTPSNNDYFVGTRLALNDTANSQFLMGAMIDAENLATAVYFEASRRLGDQWKVEMESRIFENISDSDILRGMLRDDYIQVRLQRFF
jgi:hypothetical protein